MHDNGNKDIKDFVRSMKNYSNYVGHRITKTIASCKNDNDDDNKSVRSVNSCTVNRLNNNNKADQSLSASQVLSIH